MKAAVYTRYGPPEVIQIEEVPRPVPGDSDVLVRVHATTVSAADWRLRKADPYITRFMTGLRRPTRMQILGSNFAGTVESVGKNVTRFAEGDEVFGSRGFKFGAHAEYVCVREDGLLARKPVNVTFEEAAAVLFGGAWAGPSPWSWQACSDLSAPTFLMTTLCSPFLLLSEGLVDGKPLFGTGRSLPSLPGDPRCL